MNPATLEDITEAAQSVDLALSAVRKAHKNSIYNSPLAEIPLQEAMRQAVELNRLVASIRLAAEMEAKP